MKTILKTDKGRIRENNEDSLLVDNQEQIFLLADGMGGHQAGEVASKIAVDSAYAYLKGKISNSIPDQEEITRSLVEALYTAHDAIKEKAEQSPDLTGMGTTFIGLVIKDGKAFICHIGDSRVYLFRDGITQITQDQTWGAALLQNNILTKEQIPRQKWHTLTQAVGVSETLIPEIKQIELSFDDILLLCSDGLTDMLSDEEIEELLQKNRDLEQTANKFISQANKKGGRDNISLILIKMSD